MARHDHNGGHHYDDYNHDGGPDISGHRTDADGTLGGVIAVPAGPDNSRLL